MAEYIPKPQRPLGYNVKKDTSKKSPRPRPLPDRADTGNLKMEPKIVGYYSIHADRGYVGDASLLKYIRYVPRHELPFDLNEKCITSVKFDQNQNFLNLLTFLKQNKAVLNVEKRQQLEDAPFVCTKSTLTLLLQSQNLMIAACLSNNVIYLSAAVDNKASISTANQIYGEKACAWGLKFQQFMRTDEPGGEVDTEKYVFDFEAFFCVFKSQLNDHTILYSGTVDGIRLQGKKPLVEDKTDMTLVLEMLNKADLVDLHTTECKGSKKSNNFRKFKTRKFWSQAYVAGLNNIVLGLRDKDGSLLTVEESSPTEIHRAANNAWRPQDCLKVCNNTLTTVKKALVERATSMCLENKVDVGNLPKIEVFFKWQQNNCIQVLTGTEAFPKIHDDQLI